jgi:hypothetical protein
MMDVRRLPAVMTILVGLGAVTSTAVQAQVQTYYHAGAWDAFSGRGRAGGAVCGVGYTNPSDNRRLSLAFDIGGTDTTFAVSKPDWAIPDTTRVPVVVQVGLNTPWTQQATGHGQSIEWTLDRGAMQTFDRQFRGASLMTVTFPGGNEPPWSVPLTGSAAISETLARCIRDLTRQIQTSPAPLGRSPEITGPTQPFSVSPSGPAQ